MSPIIPPLSTTTPADTRRSHSLNLINQSSLYSRPTSPSVDCPSQHHDADAPYHRRHHTSSQLVAVEALDFLCPRPPSFYSRDRTIRYSESVLGSLPQYTNCVSHQSGILPRSLSTSRKLTALKSRLSSIGKEKNYPARSFERCHHGLRNSDNALQMPQHAADLSPPIFPE